MFYSFKIFKVAGTLALVALVLACDTTPKRLPIMGERDAVTKEVDGKMVTDTVYNTIPDFAFINQEGDTVTQKNVAGKIYVTDFFFTSCTSICPIMHRNIWGCRVPSGNF